MAVAHFVRVGVLGNLGRFASLDGVRYPRATRVIVRTDRGLEVGQVLAPAGAPPTALDGQLLRGVTPEDDLLLERLQRHRDEAFRACAERLRARNVPAVLMDVEHLFDGQSLFFYFLGPITPELEAVTGDLAEAYEAQVQLRQFAETLASGCGPDCGTEAAAGCGTGGCVGCGLAPACQPGDAVCARVPITNSDAALAGLEQTVEMLGQGRLASAILAYESHACTRSDVQADIFQCLDT